METRNPLQSGSNICFKSCWRVTGASLVNAKKGNEAIGPTPKTNLTLIPEEQRSQNAGAAGCGRRTPENKSEAGRRSSRNAGAGRRRETCE
ncbi:hypothetical protein NDU88_002086 [Pleurodeles waltl]|uniref:Uncharacterized protein n=1 Tax=Pleurodeles waltl TaxID=8319 RepID=A0AAV7RAC6_PLEWA|nr:hypothetical protein NDU88_002086 [Pleurodeles waltl]